jgi:putative SOS response-associated peptidase YedK
MTRFKLTDNRTVWFEPKSAIFPGNLAAIIRVAEDGERVLEEANWGFVRLPKGMAPDRVGNVRNDTVLTNRFWTDSFRKRRCLVPFSSYCEPLGKKPASWWWHALKDEIEERPYGAFPGIWKDYTGPIKKNGENVSQRVFAFMTCDANGLESAQHHGRMPVLLDTDEQFDTWLHGSEGEALSLAKPFPDERMCIVQMGSARKDMLGDQSGMPD